MIDPDSTKETRYGHCPFCGASSRKQCDQEDEFGFCALDMFDACGLAGFNDPNEPDPDILREDRDERRRLEREDMRDDDRRNC